MRKLSVLPLVLLPGLLLGQGPGSLDATFANKREFRIPFNAGSGSQNIKELRLFVSTDQGRSWTQSSTAAPELQKFQFQADRDGTYWFSVQTLDQQGKLYPPTMSGAVASLKVIVDTQPPAVRLQPLPPRPGEVGVNWKIDDENFDPALADAVRLEFRRLGEVNWQPLLLAPGATQHYWNPNSGGTVEVRLRARDRAGNVGEGTATVSLTGAGQGYQPPSTNPNPPPAAAPESELLKLGAGERRFVRTKQVTVNCELKDFGPSGVSVVELWWTTDARSWTKKEYPVAAGDDQTRKSVAFEAQSDGVYGITLLARSGVGLGDRPPQIGERPQMWIEVDTTKPTVNLVGVVVGTGVDKGKVTVSWIAQDKNLTATPIALSYAEKMDGPWRPIADKLPNNRTYVWSLPPDGVPFQFHLKVEAIDLAGNVGEAITPNLVKVDLATPKVKIITVEPSK
jgi:hypothetical protein